MTAEDYLEQHTHKIYEWDDEPLFVTEDDAYEAVDMAKREIAWLIHEKVCTGATISEINKYVTDICDF